MKAAAALVAAIWCAVVPIAHADAGEDWQRIEALEAEPPPGDLASREQAQTAALRRLEEQERVLRNFARAYPADPRSFDARLRLARLLSVRADLSGKPKARAESRAVLDELGKSAPAERRADVAFARISISMRQFKGNDTAARTGLLREARAFQKTYPDDRRVPALLVEVATLFDDEPAQKEALLREADPLTTDADLKGRIGDDRKRIAQLGKVVELQSPPGDGRDFDLAKFRGKVVVICWFADWSPPAMMAVRGVRDAVRKFPRAEVQAVGVSLDEKRAALAANVSSLKLDWPIVFDGRGWESPFAREFGINALPTVWVLDTEGKLRVLNVHGNLEGILERMLREGAE